MKRLLMVGCVAAGSLSGAAAVAQDWSPMSRGGMGRPGMGMTHPFSPEDIEAFTDARIAALRAGLRLNADQDRLWPSVEEAIRNFVKLRRDQMRAWRESRDERRDDIPGMLRSMADRQGARADALRKLADASAPLYGSLDDGQKRRLRILMREMRHHRGMMRHAWRDGAQSGRPMDR